MKRNLIAITVLLALAGLTYIQFRLLVIGARLEKQKFDQRADVAQRNIRENLNRENPVSDHIVRFLKLEKPSPQEKEAVADSLQVFLKKEFAAVDIFAQFSFCITPRNSTKPDLTSNNFVANEFNFGEYSVPLGDYFTSKLFTEKTLCIDVKNLFTYLLAELDYLVVPSILCVLAILFCLALLINILRKEEKLNTIKNDFINNLTHELKTPAFSISLSGKMAEENLKKGNLEKVQEFLKIIERENNKLKTHTEKVLELASLENARHNLSLENADLHELVRGVCEEFFQKIKNNNGELAIRLNAENHHAKVDLAHFKNIVRNLLDNAIKYGNHQPVISIETKNQKRYFVLSIKDNGIGIPADQQKNIFTKFYRVTSGNLHQAKGFGLGLSYVSQAVRAHGGKVELESEEGKGSVFRVFVALKN